MQLPKESDALKQWMYNLYYEKEEMLTHFYEKGSFPSLKPGDEARPLEHNPARYVILNCNSMTKARAHN